MQSTIAPAAFADIAPDEVARRRSLFRRRGPLKVDVAGEALSFWCLGEAPNHEVAGTDRVAFTVSIGDAAAMVFMPRALAEQVLQPAGLEGIGDEIAGMLLEQAFAGSLPALERALGRDLAVVRRDDAGVDEALLLHLRCERESTSFDGVLALDAKLADVFAVLLGKMPQAPADLADLTMILTAAVGSAVLPQQDIDDLGPGDVILPHTPPLAAGKAWLELGGRPMVALDCSGRCMTVRERLYQRGETPMETESPDTRAADSLIDDAELDDLAMKLVFEVGRFEMSLGDLRRLAPGHVFSLDRDPEQSVDIVVSGRRIGSGQLVRVGERLGVKVLRLGQDG